MKKVKLLMLMACVLSCLTLIASRNPAKYMQPAPEKKKCTEYESKETVYFSVDLKYDYQHINKNMPGAITDFGVYGLSLDPSGSIKWLNQIITPMTDNLPENQRPYIKATINSNGKCTGSLTYNIKESKYVNGNTLSEVSFLNNYFQSMTVEVATMLTNSGYQILWSASVTGGQVGGNLDSNVKTYKGAIGNHTIRFDDQRIYLRRIDDTFARVVDNTVLLREEFMLDDIIEKPIARNDYEVVEVNNPTLNKPVNIGNKLDESVRWDNEMVTIIEETRL